MRSDILTLAFHKIWNLPTSYVILGLLGGMCYSVVFRCIKPWALR